MGANTVHTIIEPFRPVLQLTFNPQGRKLVGDHPYLPARLVRRTALRTTGEDFRRRASLVATAQRAVTALDLQPLIIKTFRRTIFLTFLEKFLRTATMPQGHDHPAVF